MIQDPPVGAARLEDIRNQTEQGETLHEVTKDILSRWSEQKRDGPNAAAPYFNVREELSVQNGIIFCGERAVLPKSLRKDMLQRIHGYKKLFASRKRMPLLAKYEQLGKRLYSAL